MAKSHVTIKEVAAAAGVSYQTVSKVINNQIQVSKDTEQRIWEAVNTLGYKPNYVARSLRAQRSFTIGYSWPSSPDNQTNPILDHFLQSMFVAAEAHGYYLLCFPYHENYQRHLDTYNELIDTGRVDGFVLSSIEYNDPRVLLLMDRKIPFVAFGRSNPELSFSWIDVDGGQGIRQEMEHIIAQGHQKIGVLAWPEDSRVGNNRISGYFDVMHERGLEVKPEWIRRGQGCFDYGYQAALEILDLPKEIRPTALIAMNDLMAVGAIQAAKSRGIAVGRDFAVGGFDDYPMTQYIDPPLTTLRQPIIEVGKQIITMLLEVINGENNNEPRTLMLNPELVIRGSTVRN
jgi:DNA-binding LacI/PurR family transcriptional regulator